MGIGQMIQAHTHNVGSFNFFFLEPKIVESIPWEPWYHLKKPSLRNHHCKSGVAIAILFLVLHLCTGMWSFLTGTATFEAEP
jgi:hypothetical protein